MIIIELERLLNDYKKEKGKAILDRCYDSFFCDTFGLSMGDRYLYSRIERLMMDYDKQKDLS